MSEVCRLWSSGLKFSKTHKDLTSFANQFLISRLVSWPSPLCTTVGKTEFTGKTVILWKMSCKKVCPVIYIFSFAKQAICCHSTYLSMGKILSYEKLLLCNSKCIFLEKWGAGGFTDVIKN